MSDLDLAMGIGGELSLLGSDKREAAEANPVENFDWEGYCFDENSDSHAKLDHDKMGLAIFLRGIRNRYPTSRKFKKVAGLSTMRDNQHLFLDYAVKNNYTIKDVVLDDQIFINQNDAYPDKPYYFSFAIIGEKFDAIYLRNRVNGNNWFFLFFNDYNFIKDTFYKKDQTKYPPGIYELGTDERGSYILNKVSIDYLDKPILNKKMAKILHKDIKSFFKNKKFYEDNNLPRKRGLIFYGPHGNGKTTYIKDTLSKHKKTYRLLVDCGEHFSQELYNFLQEVFPKDGEKIIVFEDVEAIGMGGDGRSYAKRSSFLNFIDGPKTMENTLFLATTNHPDLVDKALIDRPSRFDKIYKIDLPDQECREKHLLKWFPKLSKEEIMIYTEQTKDFSGAYFKELFILEGSQEMSIEEAISSIKSQMRVIQKNNFDEHKPMGLTN